MRLVNDSEVREASPIAAVPAPADPIERFVVHEWGTYTSAMGSDGWELRGMHTEEEALPSFVYEPYFRDGNLEITKGVWVAPFPTTQKLETPVLYFYADEDVDVTVDVAFPLGIISQMYPRHADVRPDGVNNQVDWNAAVSPAPVEDEPTVGDRVTWEIRATLGPVSPPEVDPDGVWAPSRRVAAMGIRTRPGDVWWQHSHCRRDAFGTVSREACAADFRSEEERFIFYRGLGRFRTDLSVTSVDDSITLHNAGLSPIPAVFVLDVDPAAGTAWIAPLGVLPGESSVPLDTSNVPDGLQVVPLEAFADHAADLVHAELVATGLYDDEARAMVDTWRRSYFELPGLRVLYIAPSEWADALLPITIRPQPTEIVRTFIGRIEVFTEAREAELVEAFTACGYECDHMKDELERLYSPALFRMYDLLEGDARRSVRYLIDREQGSSGIALDVLP
jgi:hypothetical protein